MDINYSISSLACFVRLDPRGCLAPYVLLYCELGERVPFEVAFCLSSLMIHIAKRSEFMARI